MQMREIRRDGFLWIDMIDPTQQDLDKIGQQFQLDPITIHDCMEPEHLPKLELLENHTFIILRAYDLVSDKKSDTVQKITNKVAMFFSNEFLITIHRQEQPYITEIFDKTLNEPKEKNILTHEVANRIMFRVAKTYEIGLDTIYKLFESLEQDIFNKTKKLRLIQSYLLKRRIDVMRRVLTLMKAPVLGLMTTAPARCRLEFKDTKEYLDKVNYQVDVIHDNLLSLLSLQVSLASQITNEASLKTSEVMRVLTIISIFFMPLNFVVGFYGMNFENLPFLRESWGYVLITAIMISFTTGTYFWMKRKRLIKTISD